MGQHYGPTDTRLRWGGIGGGGIALENYTERKTIWLQLNERVVG
jgi:hypothetical protein